jgi:hypothetical protein
MSNDLIIVNDEFERIWKWLWPNLKYYPLKKKRTETMFNLRIASVLTCPRFKPATSQIPARRVTA